MRAGTVCRILELHGEIKRLIAAENAHDAKKRPKRDWIEKQQQETSNGMWSYSPESRETMVWASATFPKEQKL